MTTQLKTRPKPKATAPGKEPQLDLIIIGGGPAGLTAALYAIRARLKILVVEKMILGGMVSTTYLIENYPGFPEGISGMELSNNLQYQVKKLGLETLWGNVTKIKKSCLLASRPSASPRGGRSGPAGRKKDLWEINVDGKAFSAKAIIIATGTEAAKLNVTGEDEFRGRGVSYCATCDGPFYKDKNVIVVGGGNAAVEEALFLTRYAKKISIVHRRDKLRADKILGEQASANPKVYFFWHAVVEEICGKQKVEEVVLKDVQSNKKIKVPIDGVFVYIGSKPNSEVFKDMVKLDKKGFMITDENMQTSTPGIFAAGDIRVKPLRQIVTAASDGAIAAESARKYIEKVDN